MNMMVSNRKNTWTLLYPGTPSESHYKQQTSPVMPPTTRTGDDVVDGLSNIKLSWLESLLPMAVNSVSRTWNLRPAKSGWLSLSCHLGRCIERHTRHCTLLIVLIWHCQSLQDAKLIPSLRPMPDAVDGFRVEWHIYWCFPDRLSDAGRHCQIILGDPKIIIQSIVEIQRAGLHINWSDHFR